MSTISEKLIQLKNMKQDIKDAINSGGGNVGDDFSTYAGEVNKITSYQNPDFYELRTSGGTNYDYLFASCPSTMNIDYIANWDTSRVTSMSHMFESCNISINENHISNWDLSSLTNASYMFNYFTNNNTYLDLSVLDFSNVSNISRMFSCANTDYLDVRNINLTGATDYSYLFDDCKGTEIDLSSWNIDNVTSLYCLFDGSEHTKIDLTGWRTTNVTNFSSMFSGYSSHKLTHLIIPDWDMTNATNTGNFIYTSYSKLKYIDLSRSNDVTISKIASMLPTKTATTYGDILVPVDTSQDVINALIAKYWRPIGPKLDLISTDIILELDEIKPGKTTKVWTGNNNPWYGDDRVETIEFISSDESIATVNGREITSTGVEGTIEISARNKETQEIISTAPITLSVSETDNYPNLIKFRTNGNEGTNNILKVNGTSLKASNLTYDSASKVYSYDPGKQITSFMCYYSISSHFMNELIKFNFNAANITSMEYMFGYFEGTTLDLSDWDTSSVTCIASAFCDARKLKEIIGELDLSSIDFSANKYVNQTFSYCYELETLYLKNIYKNSIMSNHPGWSINLGNTKVKDSCLLYIINELPNLYDKGITNNTNIIFTLPKTNTLTAEQIQPAIDKGWIVANITYEVNE